MGEASATTITIGPLLQVVEVFFELGHVIVDRDLAAGQEALKPKPVHLRQSAGLGQGDRILIIHWIKGLSSPLEFVGIIGVSSGAEVPHDQTFGRLRNPLPASAELPGSFPG